MLARDNSAIPGFCGKIGDFGLARNFQMQSRIQTRMYGTVRSQALWNSPQPTAPNSYHSRCPAVNALLTPLCLTAMTVLQVSHIPPEMMESGIASKVRRLERPRYLS